MKSGLDAMPLFLLDDLLSKNISNFVPLTEFFTTGITILFNQWAISLPFWSVNNQQRHLGPKSHILFGTSGMGCQFACIVWNPDHFQHSWILEEIWKWYIILRKSYYKFFISNKNDYIQKVFPDLSGSVPQRIHKRAIGGSIRRGEGIHGGNSLGGP